MSRIKKPYFMKNEEWYIYNDRDGIVGLTEKAPLEAIESYKKYIEEMEKGKNEIIYISEDKSNLDNLFGI